MRRPARSPLRRLAAPLLAFLGATVGCAGGSGPGAGDSGETSRAGEGESDSAGAPPAAIRGGEALVRSLGCASCHDGVPLPEPAVVAPPLAADTRNDPAFVFSVLLDPAVDGVPATGARMPDFHLSGAESLALALYLAGGGDGAERETRASASAVRAYRSALRDHAEVDPEAGAKIFVALNCAGCHAEPGITPWRNGPDLEREAERARPAWLAAWLRAPTAIRPFGARPGTGGRMPDFGLRPDEADSIAAFLLSQRLPDADAPVVTGGLTAHRAAKAEGLLRDRLACLGCHRMGDEGGRIGPDLSDVSLRRPADYVRRIVADPDGAAPGTVMPPVPMSDARRRLVTAFLLARDPDGAGTEPSPDDPRDGYLSLLDHVPRPPTSGEIEGRGELTGAETYARRCALCHGLGGEGNGFNARYLPVAPTAHAAAEIMSPRPSSTLFDGVYAGGRILGRSHRMPPFGESLSRERIWDLVAHIRALCRCRGPGWSIDNGEIPARVESAGASPDGGRPPGAGPR